MLQHTCEMVSYLYPACVSPHSRFLSEKSYAPPQTTNLRQFVGEETPLPTPPNMSRSASQSQTSTTESGVEGLDPNTWSREQQQLFTALLNAAGGRAGAQDADALQQQQRLLSAMLTGASTPPSMPQGRASSAPPPPSVPDEDTLSALMSMASSQGGGGLPPMPNLFQGAAAAAPPAPKTLLQSLLPVIHVMAAWVLLAYFVLFKEPEAYEIRTHGAVQPESRWARWAELIHRKPDDGWGVQFVVRDASPLIHFSPHLKAAILLGLYYTYRGPSHMENIPRTGEFTRYLYGNTT